METNIQKQIKNPFLDRTEYIIEITSSVPPKSEELTSHMKFDSGCTVIKRIGTSFGKSQFIAEAVVYNSPEARKKIEIVPQKVRKKMIEEEKAREAAEKKKAEEEHKAAEEAKKAKAEAAEEATEEASPEKTSSGEKTEEKKE